MYYDEIIDIMFPGIFITIGNKTEEGYNDVFNYIKYYLDQLFINRGIKYNFESFITDFEKALYNAFNNIFNKEKNIKQIGCHFHYLQNIRKYFQKKGIYKQFYDNLIITSKFNIYAF